MCIALVRGPQCSLSLSLSPRRLSFFDGGRTPHSLSFTIFLFPFHAFWQSCMFQNTSTHTPKHKPPCWLSRSLPLGVSFSLARTKPGSSLVLNLFWHSLCALHSRRLVSIRFASSQLSSSLLYSFLFALFFWSRFHDPDPHF